MKPCVEGVLPRWGLGYSVGWESQGDALGYGVNAPLARWNPRPTGAKPISSGQRSGFWISPRIRALKGRHPEAADHFANPNQMVKYTHPEVREPEERIAENVTEILETA